ncbi:MAG: type II toxin-antitoxin system HicA family toxin [Minisyncoccia bacterium]
MPRLPRVTAKQMVSVLQKCGFAWTRQSGSHAIYKNEEGLRATVPVHSSTILHPKIVKTILRDANISTADFKKML